MNANNQEYIVIKGARENNLQNVTLRVPKRKITIFTGVSGSGKSSIVFDTIAAESTRLLNENFSMFVRNFLPKVPQPDTDGIENLSMAVIVDQKRLGGGSHSTMGTITDISPIVRLLFSRIGVPHVGPVNLFSFNDPLGRCPDCNGIGRKLGVDMAKAVDRSKSLNEGALKLPGYGVNDWEWNMIMQSGDFDLDLKLEDYPKEKLDELLYAKAKKIQVDFGGKAMNITVEGMIEKFTNKYIKQDVKAKSERTQKTVMPFITEGPCSSCHGTRLSQTALSCKINEYNIAELSAMEVGQLIAVVGEIGDPSVAPVVQSLTERLQHLVDIGLDYLTLDRETDTLSGGESQRVKMVKHLSGSLVDVTYIFDEPSVGLHPRDVHRLNELLQKLRDKGNTVIVVEHDPDVIKGGRSYCRRRASCRQQGRPCRLRRQLRGLACGGYIDRYAYEAPASTESGVPEAYRDASHCQCQPAQSEECQRGCSGGCVDGRDRRSRFGQKHADQRCFSQPAFGCHRH